MLTLKALPLINWISFIFKRSWIKSWSPIVSWRETIRKCQMKNGSCSSIWFSRTWPLRTQRAWCRLSMRTQRPFTAYIGASRELINAEIGSARREAYHLASRVIILEKRSFIRSKQIGEQVEVWIKMTTLTRVTIMSSSPQIWKWTIS